MILRFPKIVLHNKIINKTQANKNTETPLTVLEKIISQIMSWNLWFFKADLLIAWFMLTIFIKTYCDNVVVNMRPIYLNKHLFLLVSSQLESKTIMFYYEENVHWKWDSKIYFSRTYNIKEYVKIVKVYMVKFNITNFNRIKESGED